MFFLYSSNRTERLLQRLFDIIEADPPGLFDTERFLVQNRGMERMLCQALAEQFGVWGNSSFFLPLEFIDFLAETSAISGDAGGYEREVLTWRLEHHLRNSSEHPDLAELSRYLDTAQSGIKRYQLARRLADLFDQYQIMRPDYLRAWEQEKTVVGNGAERWQSYLWRLLRRELPDGMDRGTLLYTISRGLVDSRQLLPQRLFVFGVHTAAPLFLDLLERYARISTVYFFLLSPCRIYWGDNQPPRGRLKQDLGAAEKSQSAWGHQDEGIHPLLANLGRQGADFQELILDTVQDYIEEDDLYYDPIEHEPPTLLRCLQSDLLNGIAGYRSDSLRGDDDSLLVVSCHSRVRELEVLKQYIYAWLYEDEALAMHDIVVMAPNIEQYAPYIPALFGDLQYDIADCAARWTNSYIRLFAIFLERIGGRCLLSELMGLLASTEVAHRFHLSEADCETLHRWAADAGIRWGLSGPHRQEEGSSSFTDGTWRAGIERMVLGFAHNRDEPFAGIVPFTEIEGSQGELLGKLWEFVAIIERAHELTRESHTTTQWSAHLRGCAEDLFGDTQEPGFLELISLLAALAEGSASYHHEKVEFMVIQEWFGDGGSRGGSNSFLNGRLTFCSMLPMRSIPFQVICLLGLDDGVFPDPDIALPFDLLAHQVRRGDRNRRDDDRYQFLEAIMAARKRLYLSYRGQSIRTNKDIAPSVLISELLAGIKNDYGFDNLVVKHPLQSFSRRYFTGEDSLFSYSRRGVQVATAIADPPPQAPSVWLEKPLLREVVEEIELLDLLRFYADPHTYFVRHVMGINVGDDIDLVDDNEPFVIEGLSLYDGKQKILASILAHEDLDPLLFRLQQLLLWPLGEPGRLMFQHTVQSLGDLARCIEDVDLGEKVQDSWVDIACGGYRLVGQIPNSHRHGVLSYRPASIKGSDIMRGWITHLAATMMSSAPVTTVIAGTDATLTIPPEMGAEDDLTVVLDGYMRGRGEPGAIFVEPALHYARQVISNRAKGRMQPLEAAHKWLRDALKNNYKPALSLLFPGCSAQELLGDEFVGWCTDVFVPLYERMLAHQEGDGSG
jgi:exodeoxyribonuclease V gamma subunit